MTIYPCHLPAAPRLQALGGLFLGAYPDVPTMVALPSGILPKRGCPPALLGSLASIIPRLDVDQFSLLKGQIIQQACRPKIVGPDALLHGDEDIYGSFVGGIEGALRDIFHDVFNCGRFPTALYDLPGARADDDQPAMAILR